MKIFVGCSSRDDIPSKYFTDCEHFLNVLLQDNDLVFGAFNGGLMGLSYKISLKYNNKVIGICPDAYKHDFENLNCNEEIIADSVNDRTKKLIECSDALVFIPGGIGTIYELYVALESKRCHEFDKPIIIYNSNGFYNKLLEFMEIIYNEKFANFKDKDLYFVSNDVNDILDYIKEYNSGISS